MKTTRLKTRLKRFERGLNLRLEGFRLRVWFNGRTSAFQADDAGSIPATRSNSE
jgi:hypothetical protein